jgi:hypothetical protein
VTDALLRAAVATLAPRAGGDCPGALERLRGRALRGLLRVLVRRRDLGRALDLLAGAPPRRAGAADAARVLEGLRRAPITCLDRALAGYAALRARGEEVRFVIGVRRDGDDVQAHAWLERGGEPLGEPADPRPRFAVALVHPRPAAPDPSTPEVPVSALQPSGDVILTELQDGTGVLLHLGTKFYYALNATGVVAWKALQGGRASGPEDVAREVAARFAGITADEARRDVERLVSELAAEGLLVAPGAGGA